MRKLIGWIMYVIGCAIVWNYTDEFLLPLIAVILCSVGGALFLNESIRNVRVR